jgi:hypothetical protein
MVYSEEIKKSVCVAHILLGSKTTEDYITAFSTLQSQLLVRNKEKADPQFIMCDFEKGL